MYRMTSYVASTKVLVIIDQSIGDGNKLTIGAALQ